MTLCREMCKNSWTDRDAVCDAESDGPKEPRIRWGDRSPMGRGNFEGEWHARRHSDVNCAKTAEPIDLPFGLWTRVGLRKHKFNRIRQAAPMCCYGLVHWHHLANTTEPSVCGGDAALCQITLTTASWHSLPVRASCLSVRSVCHKSVFCWND